MPTRKKATRSPRQNKTVRRKGMTKARAPKTMKPSGRKTGRRTSAKR